MKDETLLLAYLEGGEEGGRVWDDDLVREATREFVEQHAWKTDQVVFVDERHDWEIHLGLDHRERASDWFSDVEALVGFLDDLNRKHGCEVSIYLAFRSKHWYQPFIWRIDGDPVELDVVRNAIETYIPHGLDQSK